MILRLRQQIISGIATIGASDRILSLYQEGLLEKARESMQASIVSYKNNYIDIDAVIKTINSLIEYEIVYVERFADREKAIVQIYALTGGNIE